MPHFLDVEGVRGRKTAFNAVIRQGSDRRKEKAEPLFKARKIRQGGTKRFSYEIASGLIKSKLVLDISESLPVLRCLSGLAFLFHT